MRGISLCWLRCYAVAGESQLLTTPARPPPAAALESVRRAAPHPHTARRRRPPDPPCLGCQWAGTRPVGAGLTCSAAGFAHFVAVCGLARAASYTVTCVDALRAPAHRLAVLCRVLSWIPGAL